MYKGRLLYKAEIKDYKFGIHDIKLGVYGLFNTEKVFWNYYVISYYLDANNYIKLSEDICGRYLDGTYDNIKYFGKKFNTIEEGKKFIEEYKCKWETGSNINPNLCFVSLTKSPSLPCFVSPSVSAGMAVSRNEPL